MKLCNINKFLYIFVLLILLTIFIRVLNNKKIVEKFSNIWRLNSSGQLCNDNGECKNIGILNNNNQICNITGDCLSANLSNIGGGVVENDSASGESGVVENDSASGESGVVENNSASGESGVIENDSASGESGVVDNATDQTNNNVRNEAVKISSDSIYKSESNIKVGISDSLIDISSTFGSSDNEILDGVVSFEDGSLKISNATKLLNNGLNQIQEIYLYSLDLSIIQHISLIWRQRTHHVLNSSDESRPPEVTSNSVLYEKLLSSSNYRLDTQYIDFLIIDTGRPFAANNNSPPDDSHWIAIKFDSAIDIVDDYIIIKFNNENLIIENLQIKLVNPNMAEKNIITTVNPTNT